MESKPTKLHLTIEEYDTLLATIGNSLTNNNIVKGLSNPAEAKKTKEYGEKLEKLFIKLDSKCPYRQDEYEWKESVMNYRFKLSDQYPDKKEGKRFKVDL